MIGCLPTQALAFLAVFVYATHTTQAIVFEWNPGFRWSWLYDQPLAQLTGTQHNAANEQSNIINHTHTHTHNVFAHLSPEALVCRRNATTFPGTKQSCTDHIHMALAAWHSSGLVYITPIPTNCFVVGIYSRRSRSENVAFHQRAKSILGS